MQTYLGLEVRFCSYCGTELVKDSIRQYEFAVCPKRWRLFKTIINDKHDRYFLGETKIPKKYDVITGRRLGD